VLILVAAGEHAVQLAKDLPDWEVLFSSHGVADWLARPGARRTQVIATAAALWHIDLAAFDVLVRADGDDCTLGTHGAPGHQLTSHRPSRQLILVDFFDRHHSRFLQSSLSRRDDYAWRRWFESGAASVKALADQFIASRPPLVSGASTKPVGRATGARASLANPGGDR
jgi:hypothetical protein